MSRHLSLLIPSLACRNTRTDTFLSLTPIQHLFDHIIVSINGSDPSRALKDISLSSLTTHPNLLVFQTKQNLSSTRHGIFIRSKLLKYHTPNDLIMLLADDDLILPGNGIINYIDTARNYSSVSIGIPRLSHFGPNKYDAIKLTQDQVSSEEITPLEFLKRCNTRPSWTNMSGMIVPVRSLYAVHRFCGFFLTSGGYYEHMLMTHKSILSIYMSRDIIVSVRMHSGQESANMSTIQHYYNDIVYCLWVWINQTCTRPFSSSSQQYGITLRRFFYSLRVFSVNLSRLVFVR